MEPRYLRNEQGKYVIVTACGAWTTCMALTQSGIYEFQTQSAIRDVVQDFLRLGFEDVSFAEMIVGLFEIKSQ